jgi:hypothetical protein
MILTLHAKNAAKVTSVTLSRAYFMAGPHTQPPAQIIHSEMRLARVSCISPKGVVQMRKRCPTLAGQPPWCDQISTLAKNQLYPYSEQLCAPRHSHGSRKLLATERVKLPGVVMSIIPLDVQRRCEQRWATRLRQAQKETVGVNQGIRWVGDKPAEDARPTLSQPAPGRFRDAG